MTGNGTNESVDYNARFERVIDIMGRNHMNGLELIPEICYQFTEQQYKNGKYIYDCNFFYFFYYKKMKIMIYFFR